MAIYKKPMTLGELKDVRKIARADHQCRKWQFEKPYRERQNGYYSRFGITGTGGAGKSSVTDEIVRRFLNNFLKKQLQLFLLILLRKKQAVHC